MGKIKVKIKQWQRGAFTVELACLMPIFLMVIMGSIYLCFYVHNRAWLTAAANEAALTGIQEVFYKEGDPQEAARERGKTLLAPALFGAENLTMAVSGDKNKVQVAFDADTIASYGGLSWHLQVSSSRKAANPVSFIWKARGMKDLAEIIGGE